MLRSINNWRRERKTIRELSRLLDVRLSDLGTERAALKLFVRQGQQSSVSANADALDNLSTLAPSWGDHLRRSFAG